MLKKNSSRSGLFLLELIISILFFSMASAVCIRLFVQAHVMDRDNQNLTQSVKLCENFAEVFTASDGDLDALMEVYPYLRRDIRSTIYIEPWRDMPSMYCLEEKTVYRFLRSVQTLPSASEGNGNTNADDPSADTDNSNAEGSPVNPGNAGTDSIPADTDSADTRDTEKSADSGASSSASQFRGYAVQDMLMFLDRDFHPCLIPQSGGYVLCLISLELQQSNGTQPTGLLKNVSFGVWEYDTLREIRVGELQALTGAVDDDYFDQLSHLSEEDAIYLLDITVYVPGEGGSGE